MYVYIPLMYYISLYISYECHHLFTSRYINCWTLFMSIHLLLCGGIGTYSILWDTSNHLAPNSMFHIITIASSLELPRVLQQEEQERQLATLHRYPLMEIPLCILLAMLRHALSSQQTVYSGQLCHRQYNYRPVWTMFTMMTSSTDHRHSLPPLHCMACVCFQGLT